MAGIELVGFDADDTLWTNEQLYTMGRERLEEILRGYDIDGNLGPLTDSTEFRNLELYGYGIMSFILSLIESAIELTKGAIRIEDVSSLLELGKEMLSAEVQLMPHSREVIERLSGQTAMALITKGELHNQLRKIQESGLADHFQHVDVVPDKTEAIYAGLLERYGVEPGKFVMVGNSMKSDVLPVLELGGWAIYVPNDSTWSHEHADPPDASDRFIEVDNLGQVPEALERLLS